ncbi:hypothetical protein ACPPVU_00080 [Mucilaginibacter sp. McL0603]|uniref:hypothetical protein n=1 Tax=Mucilaginibacter sp. McL0603 TaxID=3415670 RepID=UPI003CF8FC7B
MTFIEDFKKPINYISILLAILGIASGFFFYLNSKKNKVISYNITEPSSLIYDSKNSSSAIKVIEKDSIPIKDNVYILTGTIWNSGNLPVTNEDVRQNISLNLSGTQKILDFKIIKQTDPDIAKFNLTKINNKSLGLSWKYFDPDYAFKFQIIYTGNENPGFKLNGKVLGIKVFKKVNAAEKIDYRVMMITAILGLVIIYFSATTYIKADNLIRSRNIENKRVRYLMRLMVALLIILVILTIVLIVKFYNNLNNTIPFS